MLLFTERYYRECARRVGLTRWAGPDSTMGLLVHSIPATYSPASGRAEMARVEREFLAAAAASSG
jgi:hypothetical protein